MPEANANRSETEIERLIALRRIFEIQSTRPVKNDIRIGAFAQALGNVFSMPEHPMADFIQETVRENGVQLSSSHLFTKLLRALQARMLAESYPAYPQAFTAPSRWQQALHWLFDNEDRYGQFCADMRRPLQSNVYERYKGLKLLTVLARRHLGRLGTLGVIDVGCSQNTGLNHLASGVAHDVPGIAWREPQNHIQNLNYRRALSQILCEQTELIRGVGIDMTDPAQNRDWALSCSFYPSELLDEEKVAFFNDLMYANFANVDFFGADFSKLKVEDFKQTYPNQTFNIVHFATIWYQLDDVARQQMLAVAEQLATDFVVVQDFVSIDPGDPRRLVFRDDWQNDTFPYRTIVKDMQGSDEWQEIFRWSDGRCRHLQFGLGRLAVQTTPGPYEQTASLWTPLHKLALQEQP